MDGAGSQENEPKSLSLPFPILNQGPPERDCMVNDDSLPRSIGRPADVDASVHVAVAFRSTHVQFITQGEDKQYASHSNVRHGGSHMTLLW